MSIYTAHCGLAVIGSSVCSPISSQLTQLPQKHYKPFKNVSKLLMLAILFHQGAAKWLSQNAGGT